MTGSEVVRESCRIPKIDGLVSTLQRIDTETLTMERLDVYFFLSTVISLEKDCLSWPPHERNTAAVRLTVLR